MAQLADWKYKDNQGVIKTIEMDLEYVSELSSIPEEYRFSISMTDELDETVITEYVGPGPKRN